MEPNKEILAIDLNHLEADASEQAQNMFVWGKEVAIARKRTKVLKRALALCFAEQAKAVRLAPGVYGLAKLTEDGIEQVIITMDKYKKLQEELTQAEYEQDVLEQFIIALHEKGEQIGNEVRLHGQTFWSKPYMSERPSQEDRTATAAAANAKTNKKK